MRADVSKDEIRAESNRLWNQIKKWRRVRDTTRCPIERTAAEVQVDSLTMRYHVWNKTMRPNSHRVRDTEWRHNFLANTIEF